MKTLFVNLPSRPGSFVKGIKMLPYSLLYVANYAGKFGYKVPVLDLAASPDWERELSVYLNSASFDLIGFTSTTENRFMVWDAIKKVKAIYPKAMIVVGGNHFTYTAEQTMESILDVDFLVRGEGEVAFWELLEYLERGNGSLQNIKGLSYREGSGIVHNPPGEVQPDIDEFNITDESLGGVILPKGNYSPFVYLRNWDEKIKALPITIGRGCPNKCVFCLNPRRKYRYRSIESIISEIKAKRRKFGCDAFYMEDPHLLKRTDFAREFCTELIRQDLGIVWWAETRMDIDLGILDLMRQAGCISLDFGLESASPRVLGAIRKEIDINHAEYLLLRCKSLGIRVGVFAMISLPDEHEEDACMTIRFLRRNLRNIKQIIYTVTKIFPGAELEDIARARGCLPVDFNWYDRRYNNDLPDLVPHSVPVYLEYLTPGFIRRCWDEIGSLQTLNRSLLYLIRTYARGLPGFLLDWHEQDIGDKAVSLRNACKTVGGKCLGWKNDWT